MKLESADKQNGSGDKVWPTVLKIENGEEFRQSLALAALAVRLCELEISKPKTAPIEKENLDPKKFLEQAWELIQSARQQVLREQTDAEYLAAHGGSHEAAENVFGRIRSRASIPFQKLCDPKRNKGDRELINGVQWKVYTTERGFDDLFWDYRNNLGEDWMQWMKGEKPRPLWMKRDAVMFAKLAHNKEKYPGGFKQLWKERGQSVLPSWKKEGVPRHDFLALARFRREHDKRAANLKK